MSKVELVSRTRQTIVSAIYLAGILSISVLAAILLVPVCTPNLLGQVATASNSAWIRPLHAGDPLIWGRRDGIVFGIPSHGGIGGPRGLIRVGFISQKTGKPQLLNFIATEPVVIGPGSRFSRMSFSELEPSQLDPGERGKRLWVDRDAFQGILQTFHPRNEGVQRLSVQIDVERYSANGAHVYLVASIDSDHPDELRLSVYRCSDSPPLDELTVTATMGNYERLRDLWLKHRVVSSLKLYSGYHGDAFVEHENYPLDEMLQNAGGDAIVLATANEKEPWNAPSTGAPHWHYSFKRRLTQYWRVPAHDIQPDLRVRVNGRRVYWASHDPLPGGVAFENFEVRERYKPGQTFIFGITPKEPWQFTPSIPWVSRSEEPAN